MQSSSNSIFTWSFTPSQIKHSPPRKCVVQTNHQALRTAVYSQLLFSAAGSLETFQEANKWGILVIFLSRSTHLCMDSFLLQWFNRVLLWKHWHQSTPTRKLCKKISPYIKLIGVLHWKVLWCTLFWHYICPLSREYPCENSYFSKVTSLYVRGSTKLRQTLELLNTNLKVWLWLFFSIHVIKPEKERCHKSFSLLESEYTYFHIISWKYWVSLYWSLKRVL